MPDLKVCPGEWFASVDVDYSDVELHRHTSLVLAHVLCQELAWWVPVRLCQSQHWHWKYAMSAYSLRDFWIKYACVILDEVVVWSFGLYNICCLVPFPQCLIPLSHLMALLLHGSNTACASFDL